MAQALREARENPEYRRVVIDALSEMGFEPNKAPQVLVAGWVKLPLSNIKIVMMILKTLQLPSGRFCECKRLRDVG